MPHEVHVTCSFRQAFLPLLAPATPDSHNNEFRPYGCTRQTRSRREAEQLGVRLGCCCKTCDSDVLLRLEEGD